MRIELEDKAQTGFQYTYDTDRDLVEVDLTVDGETSQIAELTLEIADRWRTGRTRIHRASGFAEPLTAAALTATDDTSANDVAWLHQIGIEVGE